MAWFLVGGATSLIGNIAGGSMDADNSAAQRSDDRDLAMWQAEAGRQDQLFGAQLGMAQFGAQAANQAGMFNAGQENALMQNMWDDKYGVANQQAKYDAFQAEFGDIKENVNNYFRTLSASSVKAQNIDDINSRMAGVDARLTQTMAERGISGSSGVAIQAIAQTMAQGETEKVLANRNVDTELASAKSQFLTTQANDPLLARAPDFEAGILTDAQKDQMNTTYTPQTGYAIPGQQELPDMPDVTPAPSTGIGGFLSSIF